SKFPDGTRMYEPTESQQELMIETTLNAKKTKFGRNRRPPPHLTENYYHGTINFKKLKKIIPSKTTTKKKKETAKRGESLKKTATPSKKKKKTSSAKKKESFLSSSSFDTSTTTTTSSTSSKIQFVSGVQDPSKWAFSKVKVESGGPKSYDSSIYSKKDILSGC